MTTKTVYRGTKLSEGLRIIDENIPKKNLYRITDRNEAYSYALANKLEDKQARGSIIQAKLHYNDNDLQLLSMADYQSLYQGHDAKIMKGKIGYISFGPFALYLVPPKLHNAIDGARIVEVV